jgi:hypothetical protein
MSGGGRAFGEIMMLGAWLGSWGLRDQMAHFAVGCGDSGAVDMDPMWEYDEDVGGGVSGRGDLGVMGAEEGGGS